MKTKEELNALKKEVESSEQYCEFTEEDLKDIAGGADTYSMQGCRNPSNCFCAVARKVIRGEYGNGEERKRRLREQGYDYGIIQNIVNKMLGYPKRHLPDFEFMCFY